MPDRYDDHELVVVTFNRPRFLFRLLAFIARDLPVGRIRVVDASREPHRSDNGRVVAAFAARMPVFLDPVEPGLGVLDHHRHALSCSTTSFMTLCHDDNLVVPAAVREQVGFLRASSGHVVCGGLVTGLTATRDRMTAFACDIDALEQAEPFDRFAHYLANHWNADFATWRTEARRATVPAFDLYGIDAPMGELVSAGVGALLGRFHVLPRLSMIFSMHEGSLTSAAGAATDVPMPDFPRILSALAATVEGFCRANGVAAPVDVRSWCLPPYLRFLAKWWPRYTAIAQQMRASCALPEQDLTEIDASALQSVLGGLLQLSPEAAAAATAETRRVAEEARPSAGELFVVQGGDVLLADPSPAPDDPAAIMALPLATELPEPQAALARLLGSADWHALTDAFFHRTAASMLGPHAGRADARRLFESALLKAIVALLRPLRGAHPARVDHLAGWLDIGALCSPARDDLLAAAAAFTRHASPELDPELPTEQPPPGPRILHSRPHPQARPLPFRPGPVTKSQGVAFIPLDFGGEPEALFRRGHPLWLAVQLVEVRGRMQLGLYGNGAFDLLVAVTDPRELFFPVRDLGAGHLVMRDLTRIDGPGLCRIGRIRWLAGPEPAPDRQPLEPAA